MTPPPPFITAVLKYHFLLTYSSIYIFNDTPTPPFITAVLKYHFLLVYYSIYIFDLMMPPPSYSDLRSADTVIILLCTPFPLFTSRPIVLQEPGTSLCDLRPDNLLFLRFLFSPRKEKKKVLTVFKVPAN